MKPSLRAPTPGTSTTWPVRLGDSHTSKPLIRSSLPSVAGPCCSKNKDKKESFSQDPWGNPSADRTQGERGREVGRLPTEWWPSGTAEPRGPSGKIKEHRESERGLQQTSQGLISSLSEKGRLQGPAPQAPHNATLPCCSRWGVSVKTL